MKKTKTIWVDLTDMIDWSGHFTGIQRVVYELSSRFKNQDNVRFFYFSEVQNRFIETDFTIMESKSKVASGETKLQGNVHKSQIRLSTRALSRLKLSIPVGLKTRLKNLKFRFFSTREKIIEQPFYPFKDCDKVVLLGGNWSFPTYLPGIQKIKEANKNIRFVGMIYDLIPIKCPQFMPIELEPIFTEYTERLLLTADKCLAISENTKQDALDFAKSRGVKPPVINVFRLGEDFIKKSSIRPDEMSSNEPFMLVTGTVEIRKNHQLLYLTLKDLIKRNVRFPKLVIVGKQGWLADSTVHLFQNDPELKGRFLWLSSASDKNLAWLYQNCQFTIYPSFYEGWGLPVAESLQNFKPCIASSTSSIPEVGGDLVEYFSPYDAMACSKLIEKYSNTKVCKNQSKKLQNNFNATSWDDSYHQVKGAIDQL